MVKRYVCDCLNVTIETSEWSLDANECDMVREAMQKAIGPGRLDDFVAKSRAVKVKPGAICMKMNSLSLVRKVPGWLVYCCGMCMKETYTVPYGNVTWDANLVLLNSGLLCDEYQIDLLKNEPGYVAALGVVAPRQLPVRPVASELFSQAFVEDSSNVDYVELQYSVANRVQEYIYREELAMKERIERYTAEQNQGLRALNELTLEQQESFLLIFEAASHSPNSEMSIDKENLFQGKRKTGSDFRSPVGAFDSGKIWTDDDRDDNDVFDLDLDEDSGSAKKDDRKKPSNGKKLFQLGAEDGEEAEEEKEDIFPLQDSAAINFGSARKTSQLSKSFGLVAGGRASQFRPVKQELGRSFHEVTVGSYPINIPNANMYREVDTDDVDNIQPGESMAASIQKMARSSRNESDSIFEDRPRHRMNTGDLLKSRPILN